ncbi:MAG: rhomboid family intramembrane serine protease [Flavobacteriales bacterium]|nr:rhomboid family intramembrane serine protease [Flavobacteriales bacterium]|tara:strand:- start:40598 stop:41329 length:732 start_codon:yes stop_codon:yes gene_type:complete
MNISSFRELPDVIKNILIINCLLFLATVTLESQGVNLTRVLGLHQFQSPDFRPYQLITHMFMHGSFTHLFYNMFAVWMFGKILENIWGGKRFLKFYIITGLGAALIYVGYIQFQIDGISNLNPDFLEAAKNKKAYLDLENNGDFIPESEELTRLVNTPMVGASGALFGILLAFGMLFPNTLLYIYFALPIKAKYFVMLYGALELFLGFRNLPGDNIAHFAHLGGMIFGFILLKYWKQDRNTFY